jgi:hypothetical protein
MPIVAVLNSIETYDDASKQFVLSGKPEELTFEHSLISVALWEARWQRAFLTNVLTKEEQLDYVGRCMVTSPTKLSATEIFIRLSTEDADRIAAYMKSNETATIVVRLGIPKPSDEKAITVELIYYYMVELGIPIEFERWHIKRLLTFIDLMSLKREEQENKGKPFKPTAAQNKARNDLNAARRKSAGIS